MRSQLLVFFEVSLYAISCFSLAAFTIFSLFLAFLGLSGCESLCVHFFFFFWSSLSLLDVYVNVFLQVWGNFGHLFFQPLSITFWSSYLHICWYVCWCLTVLRSSVQSSSFFFLLLQLGSSVLIHLNSLILSFASSSLLLSPLYKFIHFHFCTFQL